MMEAKHMQTNRDEFLNRLFAIYRDLLGEFEPSPAFAARVWSAIDARKRENASWASYLIAWSPRLAFASMALAGLVAFSHWVTAGTDGGSVVLEASYEDVLIRNAMDQRDGAIWVLAENGE